MDDWIEIRLDRALVTGSFMAQFADAKLTNLEISTSDHSPIFLKPVINFRTISNARFKFENAWLRDPMCKKIVEETWQMHQGKTLQEKIATVLCLTGCPFGEECNFIHISLSENDQIAKVTFPVDKSFAREISGEDERNSRVISLMSDASLSIKDHRSDSSLKNVEIQGTLRV
ncbi:hypothetical protein POM88_046931 [Heracleum sosnowskyi]|uniref:C3H1-type domain-containing protein n=1 Tax=Heracleum sosnowskyi TaxID=360622 RepID=A0AAD8HA91_9APIA|nr:hypothetical protein POM88_046931 [Heracleum sosnowskyi]